ncbi:uncharacterized protein KD926_001310 [Aspergillus affinis]|uniref:uncharacterized protein n=1 Tax=Aspergillus affinis TaxID=1070780 RepID=UPI0022FE11BA|nr:uncharacterized protein KD926_001310 [Aspergillus affinis]KAI9036788.1 hypothetical protein KD926_001310 [Aspergillus affinis]
MSNKTYTYGDLLVTLTSSFDAIWNDKGRSLRPLGSMAIESHGTLQGKRAALLIGANSSSSSNPPVKEPTAYELVWTDKGSKANADGWSAPSTSKVWCLRSDLAADGQYATESIWDDQKSKADVDVSIWEVNPYPNSVNGSEFLPVVAGTFRASARSHTSPPDLGYAVVPTLKIPKDFTDFTDSVPKVSANNIPSTGTT